MAHVISVKCAECKEIDLTISRKTAKECGTKSMHATNLYVYFCSGCLHHDDADVVIAKNQMRATVKQLVNSGHSACSILYQWGQRTKAKSKKTKHADDKHTGYIPRHQTHKPLVAS